MKFFIVLLLVCSVGFVSVPIQAQAATRAELLQKIEQLQKLIVLLQELKQSQQGKKGSQFPSVSMVDNDGFEIYNEANSIAVIKTNKGLIEVELFEDLMPITVSNFKKLAQTGFYKNTKFHRVIDGFIIQGGDPNSKTSDSRLYGMGGPGYVIPDEHVKHVLLSNIRGTISMANSGPNSGGSQFFINLVDNAFLDFDKEPLSSKHPVFGRVVNGMAVVDAIGDVETSQIDVPLEPVTIKEISIR